MEFFVKADLAPMGGKRSAGTRVKGFIILEVFENEMYVAGRHFDVTYTSTPKGKRNLLRIAVMSEQEQVLLYEGLTHDINLRAKIGDEKWLKVCIFAFIIEECVQNHEGEFETQLTFEDAQPEMVEMLLQLCRGRLN